MSTYTKFCENYPLIRVLSFGKRKKQRKYGKMKTFSTLENYIRFQTFQDCVGTPDLSLPAQSLKITASTATACFATTHQLPRQQLRGVNYREHNALVKASVSRDLVTTSWNHLTSHDNLHLQEREVDLSLKKSEETQSKVWDLCALNASLVPHKTKIKYTVLHYYTVFYTVFLFKSIL